MNELSTKTLSQIVSDNHRAAAVFEKYNLDFCCKGKRSLQDACIERSLPVEDLLAELSATNKSCSMTFDFNKLTLAQLVDHIVTTHHAFVKKEMPQITAYLQKIVAKHGDRHPEMARVLAVFSELTQEMEEHMQKEEFVLFPRIIETERKIMEKTVISHSVNYLQLPVDAMEAEHEQAGKCLSEIRELTNNYTASADACTTFRLTLAALQAFEMDLHQHVHLENNILFPKAIALVREPASSL